MVIDWKENPLVQSRIVISSQSGFICSFDLELGRPRGVGTELGISPNSWLQLMLNLGPVWQTQSLRILQSQ